METLSSSISLEENILHAFTAKERRRKGRRPGGHTEVTEVIREDTHRTHPEHVTRGLGERSWRRSTQEHHVKTSLCNNHIKMAILSQVSLATPPVTTPPVAAHLPVELSVDSASSGASAAPGGAGSGSGFRIRKNRKQPTRLITVSEMKTVCRSWSENTEPHEKGNRTPRGAATTPRAPPTGYVGVSVPGTVDVEVAKEQAAETRRKHTWAQNQRDQRDREPDLGPDSGASPELQQRPEDAAVPPNGAVRGVDGQHVALSRPQDWDHHEEEEDVKEESEDGKEESEDGKEESEDMKKESEDVKEKSEDRKEESEDVKEESEDMKEESEDVKEESEDVKEESEDVKEKSEDGNEESEDRKEESEDGKEESEDVKEKSEREGGVRGREGGVRGREGGVRGREGGVRGQEGGVG